MPKYLRDLSDEEREERIQTLRRVDESKRCTSPPTLDEISKLPRGDYYVCRKKIYVNALRVDDHYWNKKKFHKIYYECPWCYERFNKDGNPRKNSKKVIHSHGASSTKIGYCADGKTPHCYDHQNCRETHPRDYDVSIHVTETTEGAVVCEE